VKPLLLNSKIEQAIGLGGARSKRSSDAGAE
jgi:hypothetical protein